MEWQERPRGVRGARLRARLKHPRRRGRRLLAGSTVGWRPHGCLSSLNPEAAPDDAGYRTRGRPLEGGAGGSHVRLRHTFAFSPCHGILRGGPAAWRAERGRRPRGAECPRARGTDGRVRGAGNGPNPATAARPLERPAGPAALHGPAGKSGRWANFIAAGAHAQSGLAEKSAVAAGFVPTRAERSRVTGPAKAATRGERSHVLSPLALPVPHACRFRDTLALTTVAH